MLNSVDDTTIFYCKDKVKGNKMEKNTKILWISRHILGKEQLADLKRIYGEDITVDNYNDTVKDISDIAPLVDAYDVFAAVLPLDLMAEMLLIAGGKPVIRSVCRRTLIKHAEDMEHEAEAVFKHVHWQQIKALRLETVDL